MAFNCLSKVSPHNCTHCSNFSIGVTGLPYSISCCKTVIVISKNPSKASVDYKIGSVIIDKEDTSVISDISSYLHHVFRRLTFDYMLVYLLWINSIPNLTLYASFGCIFEISMIRHHGQEVWFCLFSLQKVFV